MTAELPLIQEEKVDPNQTQPSIPVAHKPMSRHWFIIPGIFLMLIAAISVYDCIAFLRNPASDSPNWDICEAIVPFVMVVFGGDETSADGYEAGIVALYFIGFHLLTLIGGIAMVKRQGRDVARAASLFAICPQPSTLGFGTLVGVWCVFVLFRRGATEAFGFIPPSRTTSKT